MSDLISRQAVIDRINKLIEVEKKQGTDDWGYGRERVNAYEAMLHMVKSEYLYPSVESERATGRWKIYPMGGELKCSVCKTEFERCELRFRNYCPNCGAKMEVGK